MVSMAAFVSWFVATETVWPTEIQKLLFGFWEQKCVTFVPSRKGPLGRGWMPEKVNRKSPALSKRPGRGQYNKTEDPSASWKILLFFFHNFPKCLVAGHIRYPTTALGDISFGSGKFQTQTTHRGLYPETRLSSSSPRPLRAPPLPMTKQKAWHCAHIRLPFPLYKQPLPILGSSMHCSLLWCTIKFR